MQRNLWGQRYSDPYSKHLSTEFLIDFGLWKPLNRVGQEEGGHGLKTKSGGGELDGTRPRESFCAHS